ncbi:hypothetical protein [Streptomyces sp. NPDC058157]|uniref:hypothetical protein n=1 Tax=Streptomyces sp. NPDC058157 TaxID=3346360 RepID=UPI0036E8FF39
MNGTGYGFLTAAAPDPDALTRALAEAFGIPAARVDVAPDGTVDGRNWDTALVTCEYELLRTGDLRGMLNVYAVPAVTTPPAPEALATVLARTLDTPVLAEVETATAPPSLRRVFLPQGWTTYATVEDLDPTPDPTLDPAPDPDQPSFHVHTTQTGLAAFPGAEVKGLPSAVHAFPPHTPLTNGLGTHRDLLHPWEALISRMAAGWPPARWYGAAMYRDDLAARDRLEAALPTLPDPVRTALAALDSRFRELTVDDAGKELGADPSTTPWYRHRRPTALPWRVLLPPDGSA